MSGSPQRWTTAEFGEVADIKLGKMLDKAKNRGEPTPYLRNINVRWGSFALDDISKMLMSQEERAALSIRNGDILVCEGGEPGRAAVWDAGPTDLTFQKALMRIRPYDGIDPDYLANFLQQAYYSGDLERHFTGTTIKHLPQAALSRVRLPLPPSHEQQRIVAKIDSLTGKSRRASDHLDHIPRLVDKYKQAVLAAAFNVNEMADWQQVQLIDVVTDALIGLVRGKNEQNVTHGAPYIRMNHYDLNGRWNEDDLTLVDADDREMARYELREGDLLFNTRNSFELVGKVALWRDRPSGHLYNNNLLRLRFGSQVVPAFAFYQMISPRFRSYLHSVKSATTSVCAIYQRSIMAAPWAYPGIDRQLEIASWIEAAFAKIDRLTAEMTSARRLIERLDQAVLAKAFRGELVAQDPADESASLLLERIRAEREAAPKVRRGRKAKAVA